jgi:hypothetical protein
MVSPLAGGYASAQVPAPQARTEIMLDPAKFDAYFRFDVAVICRDIPECREALAL